MHWLPRKSSKIEVNSKPRRLNNAVKKASRIKFKAFAQLRASSSGLKPLKQKLFNDASRLVKKEVFLATLEYERSIVDRCKTNKKLLYSHINSQKKCKVVIRAIEKTDGSLTTDLSEIADVLS